MTMLLLLQLLLFSFNYIYVAGINGTYCPEDRDSNTYICRCRFCCICQQAQFHVGLKHSNIKQAICWSVNANQSHLTYAVNYKTRH